MFDETDWMTAEEQAAWAKKFYRQTYAMGAMALAGTLAIAAAAICYRQEIHNALAGDSNPPQTMADITINGPATVRINGGKPVLVGPR